MAAGAHASVRPKTTEGGSARRPAVAHDEMPGLFGYFTDVPKPIIAAVNGVTAGGGFVLARKCDLRVAWATARFGLPEAKVGSIPAAGGAQYLLRAVARGLAFAAPTVVYLLFFSGS